MTRRKELEAALARAKAALADAVASADKVDGDRAAANAKIETLRAWCRRVRAAIIEAKRLESTARSDQELDVHLRQLLETSKQIADARRPSRRLRKRPVHPKKNRSQNASGPRISIRGFNSRLPALKQLAKGALARDSLIRQAIGLTALILAYLEFFYIDVQLQIATLASVFG